MDDYMNRKLTFYECLQLYDQLIKAGLVKQDPNNRDNALVYRLAGEKMPEGWYSENIHSLASELSSDEESQKKLWEELKNHDFTPHLQKPWWIEEEKLYTHNIASEILDCFEDMLEEKDITIPDDDRTGDEGEARLFGTTYGNLQDEVENILKSVLTKAGVEFVPDVYK